MLCLFMCNVFSSKTRKQKVKRMSDFYDSLVFMLNMSVKFNPKRCYDMFNRKDIHICAAVLVFTKFIISWSLSSRRTLLNKFHHVPNNVPKLTWSILKIVRGYSNISKRRLLYLHEKLYIATYHDQEEFLKKP